MTNLDDSAMSPLGRSIASLCWQELTQAFEDAVRNRESREQLRGTLVRILDRTLSKVTAGPLEGSAKQVLRIQLMSAGETAYLSQSAFRDADILIETNFARFQRAMRPGTSSRNSKGGAKVYTLSIMNGNVGEEEQYHSLEEALKEGDIAWYHLTPRERKDYVRENGGWFVLCEGYGIDGPVVHDWADEGYAEEKREALRRAKTKSSPSKQRKPATEQPRKANGQFAKKPKGGRR